MFSSVPVIKVRAHLLFMVGVVLLPAAVFAAVALTNLLQSERDSAHRSVQETARFISLAVDREITKSESTLRVPASSEKLARGEFQAFHERLTQGQAGTETWTLLTDANGQPLLNSRVPYGTPLAAHTDPSAVPDIPVDTRAFVSGMFADADSKRLIVTVNVPLHLPQGNYLLSQAFMPGYFSQVLVQTRPPPSWIVGLFDRQSISIARSHRVEEFVGEPVNAQLFEASRLSVMHKAHVQLQAEKQARVLAEADRQALYAREQTARAEAESQSRSKNAFLAMLGHELRNPLSAISGAVEVIKRSSGTKGELAATHHAHEIIERQSGHLAHIVDDLLDVSRVMSGKIELDSHPLDLSANVRRVLASLEAAGRTQRHTVELNLAQAWVNADITRLDQIVSNLLVNAFKYTPEGGTIHVTVATQAGKSVLTVKDNGVGINAALLPTIFDIFVQGTPNLERAQGGLGIGLALVKQLMQLHGARIAASSDGPGKGSTFTATFTRIDAPHAQPLEATEVDTQSLRILVVEDHADARDTLCELLQLSGHRVEAARDGLEGIHTASAGQPDVAIIDIGLPGLNGYEVATCLRADPLTQHIRLIALTGYGQAQDRQLALVAGFDTHLVKPVNAGELFRALQALQAQGPR